MSLDEQSWPKTNYEDFALKIGSRRGDTNPVFVLRFPAGKGSSPFRLPNRPDGVGDILNDGRRNTRRGQETTLPTV